MKFGQRSLLLTLLGLGLAASGYCGSYDDYFVAVRQDNPIELRALLDRGFDPNTVDPKGQPSLISALKLDSVKVAQVLASESATQIDVRNHQDETPLMLAALKGYSDICSILIERDADVNKPGWTPLHYAATGGNAEIIQKLLANHAYVDAESPNGSTPLMMAALYGTADAVRTLLNADADTGIKNSLGLTALDFAKKSERNEVIELIASKIRAQRSKAGW